MYFDGASSKEGSDVGILLVSPTRNTYKFSFILSFFYTNNVAEYEASLLGLRLIEKHGIKKLMVIGDSELVISKVRAKYACKITN